MYNLHAKNIVILFLAQTRGNFVKSCLTLSPNTADSLGNYSDYSKRLDLYKTRVISTTKGLDTHVNIFPGPGHGSNEPEFKEIIKNADFANKYVHCCHLREVGKKIMPFLRDRKFVSITLTEENVAIMIKTCLEKNLVDINKHNALYLNELLLDEQPWYNLPYDDILIKDKFLKHCLKIDKNCYIDMISDYYDIYYDTCIATNKRFINE
jgi:hypothetical protein